MDKLLKKVFSMYRKLRSLYKMFLFQRRHRNLNCNYNGIYKNTITDFGQGNSIFIEEGSSLTNCNISFYGKKCRLYIGHNVSIRDNSFWFEDEGSEIVIGEHTTTESGCQFASCEGKSIHIGKNCMLSHDIDIRNTDSHSIINMAGERINPSLDIIIGDHVWIGIRSTILKGSVIPSNTIVAAQSMVTSSLNAKENVIIAGSPARVVKENVNWDSKRL